MHSSFGPDIPRFQEFTEPVRKYRHASLIVKHREEQPEESEDDTVVFGEIDPKTLKKKRKRKRVMNLFGTPELRDALRNNGWEPGPQEVAGLQEAAEEALSQAAGAAGEPVAWCCGAVRIISRIDYECDCTNE
jgi:hypothetical protein